MRSFLKIGAIAGACGGVALALFLEIVGEPNITRAVALEEAAKPASSSHRDMFSRGTQQIGGGIGALLYGVLLGLIFAVVFVAVRHRLSASTDWRRSIVLAGAGYVTLALVPFLKYPANPPSVGDPATITRRTLLYLVMLAWSIISTWSAWRLARWFRDGRQLPEDRWVPLSVIGFSVLIGLGLVLLPGSPDKVEAPATLIWRFRLATAGGAVVFWAALGLSFGFLVARSGASGRNSRSPRRKKADIRG